MNDYLQDFKDYDKNNELIIDIMPGMSAVPPTKGGDKPAEEQQAAMTVKSLFKGSKAKQKYPVDFIVGGETEIMVQVVR